MPLQKRFVSSPLTTAAETLGQNGRKFIEENLPWPLLVDRWFHDLTGRIRLSETQTQHQLEAVKS